MLRPWSRCCLAWVIGAAGARTWAGTIQAASAGPEQDAQAIADVSAYVSQLPVTAALGHGNGASVPLGARLYANTCASCHGISAEGDAQRAYPRLAGQYYQYLLRVLIDPSGEARPDFERTHEHPLRDLQRADKVAVADYLSRLGP